MSASATPLARKLGIRARTRLLAVGTPEQVAVVLADLPPGTELAQPGERELDVIVAFVVDAVALGARLEELAPALAPAGGIWIAWPKKLSGVATGLSDSVVRAAGLAAGLVDNKVCAIDATWSALRFVRRLRDRPRA